MEIRTLAGTYSTTRWLVMLVVCYIVVIFLLLNTALSSGTANPALSPVVVWVPEEYHTGGAYTAVQAGSDGRLYLGTTFYGGFARFLVLPPGSREVELIADTATVTGESTPGPYAQAKIHTKPAIAPDGKVYFATKSGKPAKDERWQANYPGGHLLVYDPQTNRVTDLGIPRPRQSIIAVGVDPKRTMVYALTDPEGHLILYDPRTRVFTDKGSFAWGAPTRYLVVLANGDTFHPAGASALIHFDASSGRIERLPLRFSGVGTYESPYAMTPNPDGARFHGVDDRSGQVYTFKPGEHWIDVHGHGAILPEGYNLPGRHYTMTGAQDGKIYYTSVLSGGAPEGTLFIMRLTPATGRLEVVGQVAPLPSSPPPSGRPISSVRRPARLLIEGSTAGPDGTLYIMTAYPLRILIFPRLASP